MAVGPGAAESAAPAVAAIEWKDLASASDLPTVNTMMTKRFVTAKTMRGAAMCALWTMALALPAAADEAGGLKSETISFDDQELGELADEFFVIDGNFSVIEAEDEGEEGKLVRVAGEPLLDSGVLVGGSTNGPAAIKARVRAHRVGRSFPRAGIGLHGLAGHQLRLVPARREVEFAINDETVQSAPLEDFASGEWYWLELRVEGSADEGWTVTGHVWLDGEDKPEEPVLVRELETLRVTGRASLWATPYSGREIDFDDVTVEWTEPE